MEIKFNSPVPPTVNNYLGKRVAYRNGEPYVSVYVKPKARAFMSALQRKIQKIAKETGWQQTKKDIYVCCDIVAYFPKKGMDADNTLKCLQDSITKSGVIYDDSYLITRFQDIFIDAKNPHLEVRLYKKDKIGIFNKESYKKFIEDNCSTCSRFNRSCSILKKSCENYIVPEVSNNICSKKRLKKI